MFYHALHSASKMAYCYQESFDPLKNWPTGLGPKINGDAGEAKCSVLLRHLSLARAMASVKQSLVKHKEKTSPAQPSVPSNAVTSGVI